MGSRLVEMIRRLRRIAAMEREAEMAPFKAWTQEKKSREKEEYHTPSVKALNLINTPSIIVRATFSRIS